MSKNRVKYLMLIATFFITMMGTFLIVSNTPSKRLAKQLELGKKYFLVDNYEQSIIAFQNAIEIDGNNVEAYSALADIYLSQGNYDDAKKILEQGIVTTQNQELQEKNQKVIIYLETNEICGEIVNSSNSNDQEAILASAKELYNYMKPILGEENTDFIIPIVEGNVGIHVEKGYYYCIYSGNYTNGIREGKGTCVIFTDSEDDYRRSTVAVGEWKNDMPNGMQTVYQRIEGTLNDIPCINYYVRSGNMTDGLWDGEVSTTEEISEFGEVVSFLEGKIHFKNGLSQIIEYGDDRGDENVSAHTIGYGIGWNQYYNGNVKLTDTRYGSERTRGMLGYCQLIYGGTSWQGMQ